MPSTWLPQLDPGREQFANKITDMKGKSIGFPVLERKQPSYLREMGFCAVHCSVDPSLAICWMTSEIANRIIGSPEGGKHLGIANSVDLWLRNGWEDNLKNGFNGLIERYGQGSITRTDVYVPCYTLNAALHISELYEALQVRGDCKVLELPDRTTPYSKGTVKERTRTCRQLASNSVITDKGVRTPNTPRLTEGTTRSHSREMAAAAALPHLGIHCADNGNRHNRTATDKTCTTRGVMEAVQRHVSNCVLLRNLPGDHNSRGGPRQG
ncbi:hypothetical protein J6590_104279 [Homalodisca vitripennis]|nr:hypothetical protein J6590_104279 [Homalodisca vitripennis]